MPAADSCSKIRKSNRGLHRETAILPWEWGKCQGTNWMVWTKGRKTLPSLCLLVLAHAMKWARLGGVPAHPQEMPAYLQESHHLLLKKIQNEEGQQEAEGLTCAGLKPNMLRRTFFWCLVPTIDPDTTNIYRPEVSGDWRGGADRAWSASNNDYGGGFAALSVPCRQAGMTQWCCCRHKMSFHTYCTGQPSLSPGVY